jgi:hypothetical protein
MGISMVQNFHIKLFFIFMKLPGIILYAINIPLKIPFQNIIIWEEF